jgi:hypothetical protein
MKGKRNLCKILVRKAKEEKPLGRPRRGCVDNIKMDSERQDEVLWTGLAQLKMANT